MPDLSLDLQNSNESSLISPALLSEIADSHSVFGDAVGISPVGLFLKRCVDLLIAIPALVLLAPVFAVIAVAVKLDSRGPALYRSPRVGLRGCIFNCLKFRSMIVNADELKECLRDQNERKGATFKIAADPRVTPLGRFLRRYSLDELPQIINVIVGDMSVVGPRPHPLDDVARYELHHLKRCGVKPGLTGLWQVHARCNPSFELNMKLDMKYIRDWSLGLDLLLIIKTFGVIFRGEGQ